MTKRWARYQPWRGPARLQVFVAPVEVRAADPEQDYLDAPQALLRGRV